MELVFSPTESLAIKKFGSSIEHNWNYFSSLSDKKRERVVVKFKDGSEILALHSEHVWKIVGEPLGEQDEKISLVYSLISYLFSRNLAKKINFETKETTRWHDLQKHTDRFKISTQEKLHLGIFDLSKWPADTTSLRKIHFHLDESKFKEANFSAQEQKQLVLNWIESIGKKEYSHIFNLIDSKSASMQTRMIESNGKPASLISYWQVGEKMFVGLHAYLAGFGEASAMEFLLHMKSEHLKSKKPMTEIVFGIGGEEYLSFVNKLAPTRIESLESISILNAN